uniref:Uncharacterized protein n=1 Tax=Megaselia scalaris TaxID=36166 RepID=T1GIX7_MEGSC
MPTTINTNNCSPTGSSSNHNHHHNASAATNRSPQSPNRRPRGESKKCRKVYGMDRKEEIFT